MVDDLGTRHVQDELLAALGPRPARDPDRPVRMRLEQLAVLADHLGLDPQPEPEAERLDLPGEAVDPVGSLRRSTNQSPSEVVSSSRSPNQPSSRTNSSTPRSRAAVGDLEELRLVEVEVGRLPVVDAGPAAGDRARCRARDARGRARGARRSARRGPRRSRRGRPRASRTPRPARAPGEGVRADPEPDPGRVERVDLGLGQEVARVDEAEAVAPRPPPRWSSRGAAR